MRSEDNELMCRVEPGTPMNEAFKRYWLPAGLSSDLPDPDSDPKRVTMLCEDYVMFRDSNGKIGFMDELCCHRGASLCLGRVEDSGIRCIFHGWKFAVDGTIQDMPNESDGKYKNRYRQPAYPVVEKGGFIWVYLGPRDKQPPEPDYYWLQYPEDKRDIAPLIFECNYLQAVDGGADSSHLTILHQDALRRPLENARTETRERILADAAPRFDVEQTEFGQFSVAIRKVPGPDGKIADGVRTSAFIAPSTVLVGGKGAGVCGIAMPITSERTVFYINWFSESGDAATRDAAMKYQNIDMESRIRLGIDRASTDKNEKFSRANNWTQDRESMKSGTHFTGLPLFIPEDIAVAESAGRIFDRSKENLVPADLAIVRIRRTVLSIAQDVMEGRDPIGTQTPVDTSKIATQEMVIEPGRDWREAAIPAEFQKADRSPPSQ